MTRNELEEEKMELAKELATVEPVISPSVPAVEIEMPVEPEVGEEGVAVVKLIISLIVDIEDVNTVSEAVAPVVEQGRTYHQ